MYFRITTIQLGIVRRGTGHTCLIFTYNKGLKEYYEKKDLFNYQMLNNLKSLTNYFSVLKNDVK